MITTDLGACEWFVWDLRRSNLIDRAQLDQVIVEFLSKNPGAEPPALAQFLVTQGVLTEFQAERLLQGKTQGFVLGPFTLTDALGTGSMGTVYKAQSKVDSAWYAVKVLPRRSMWNVRIARRKVRAFEQCKHQAVVPFVDVGTSGGMHYLAWPLVNGTTLDKIVAEQGQLPAEQVANYALQVAQGLEQAHAADLFHGLLKPANLMLDDADQIRILDFGIGCLLAEAEGESLVDTMSTANSVNSGLDCSSPESIMDPTNLTAVGDQYSLGCVMYFLLTGQYPFPDGTAVEKMMSHQHKQPKPILEMNPNVPPDLVAVIEKLMAKQPAMRYPSCSEVIDVLKPFAQRAGNAGSRLTKAVPRLAPLRSEKAAAAAPGQSPPNSPTTPAGSIPRHGSDALPPRAPSALAAKLPPRPAGHPRPSAQGLPPPGALPTPTRTSAQGLAPRPGPQSTPSGSPSPQGVTTRSSAQGTGVKGGAPRPSAQGAPAPAAKATPAPTAKATPAPAPQQPEPEAAAPPTVPQYRSATLGQRLGNFGIIMLSMLFGIIAYIVSSMIKF